MDDLNNIGMKGRLKLPQFPKSPNPDKIVLHNHIFKFLGHAVQGLDYCRQKAEESRSSFLSGFRFLPQEKRDAITVLYAFCRELDDVVDGCSDIGRSYIST